MDPGTKLGPFVIEDEIGSGAMGAVYRAQYRDKALRVAIKVMAPHIGSSETAQARFQREAEILKTLQHPNIVRLLAVGQYKKSPFYAMEYIEGETLDDMLQRRGRLPWEEVVRLGRQLCGALQHAHEKNIVHRDLKPSNIMLLRDGTLKLTDFGIAKVLDMSGLTATNCTVGTASYMSPEQCKGDRDIGHKSDLYSMGVMFYELVTGTKPFQAEAVMDMFMLHVKGKFQRPSKLLPDIPVWLDNLICQMLEKKPEDRPMSAKVVADALSEVLEKVEARQSAGIERASARTREKGAYRPRLDDTDREAARTMLSKRKKKKSIPFYEQGWFTLAIVGVMLAGLAYGVYYFFFVPPSLDSLYQQTSDILVRDDYESWMAARDGPLYYFQANYATAEGNKANQMRFWADDVASKLAEHQMLKRRSAKLPADTKGEKTARLALDYEDLGQLSEAMTAWQELEKKQSADQDQEKRAWGLVAKKRFKQLDQLAKSWTALATKVADDKDHVGMSKEEMLAVEALRAEQDNKQEAAKELWTKLRQKTLDEDDQRNWFLLASYQLQNLKKKPAGEPRN